MDLKTKTVIRYIDNADDVFYLDSAGTFNADVVNAIDVGDIYSALPILVAFCQALTTAFRENEKYDVVLVPLEGA